MVILADTFIFSLVYRRRWRQYVGTGVKNKAEFCRELALRTDHKFHEEEAGSSVSRSHRAICFAFQKRPCLHASCFFFDLLPFPHQSVTS